MAPARARRAFMALLAILLSAAVGLPAAAGSSKEPWIFVRIAGPDAWVHFDDKVTEKDGYPKVVLQANFNKVRPFTQGPAGDPGFYRWLVDHQDNFDDDSCMGRPFPDIRKIGRKAEVMFTDGFDWLLHHGFTDADFGNRPHGPLALLQPHLFSSPTLKATGTDVTYFFCSKGGGFLATLADAENHRTVVGSQTVKLDARPPVFQMSAAHEQTHLAQFNLGSFAMSKQVARIKPRIAWIIEGTADATGMFATNDLFSKAAGSTVTPTYGPFSDRYYRRFFLSRAYNIPLNFRKGADKRLAQYHGRDAAILRAADALDDRVLSTLDYKTNGFWYNVIERYLKKKPAGLKPLYRKLTPAAAMDHPTRLVDEFLDTIDGPSMKGLEHVFPQFLTEYATWWAHRFGHRMGRRKWEQLGFNGCETATLSRANPKTVLHLQLAAYAGDCFRVTVQPDAASLVPDLQIRTQAADDGADEVYLGQASARNLADAVRNVDCYEIVAGHKSSKPAPCLLQPTQGISSATPQLARLFTVFEIGNSDGKPVELEFVASRVPGDMHEVGKKLSRREIDVTLSLDLAASNQSPGPGGRSGRTHTAGPSADERVAVPRYGAKPGRGKILPQGDKSMLQATVRDFMAGRVKYLPDEAAPFLDKQLTVAVGGETDVKGSPGDSYASVTFMLPRDLQPGMTGDIKVMAMSASGADRGTVGYQNPDQPSRLTILEFSDTTLRFRGTAHVCEGDIMQYSGFMAARTPKLCDVLPRKTYRVSGAIAFPLLRNSVGRLQSHDTQAYLDYQALSVDQLVGPDNSPTIMDMLKTFAPDAARKLDAARGAGAVPEQDTTGEAQAPACRTRQASGACDCSCAAKACQIRHPEEAALECSVVCSAKWGKCGN